MRTCLFSPLRRGRDSNPRWSFWPHTPLAGERLQPLGHLSNHAYSFGSDLSNLLSRFFFIVVVVVVVVLVADAC